MRPAFSDWKKKVERSCGACKGSGKLSDDAETIAQLRSQLAAALSDGADAAAQRDTALGLCKERERELAEVRAERALARKLSGEYLRLYEAERAAHAETRKALEDAMSILSSRDEIAEAALESTRAELARSKESEALAWQTHASAARQLQDAEARVKELESELRHDGF